MWQYGRIWRAIIGEVFFQQFLIQGNQLSEFFFMFLVSSSILTEFYNQCYMILP
jgi:hypothetical protein